ncbi:Phosphomannomutase-2 [Giardia lamblia P15]|uniref:Phosphomannomutase-2 n=1 Tax=Giardia intestinalis (strain P15) TaxID=658858 RepID=E1F8J8_GIAIA|nr:Phosphomannomutase-2 [Giardia lamblia P15]
MINLKDKAERLIKEWLNLDFWPATRAKALEMLAHESYVQIQKDFDPQNRLEIQSHGLQGDYGPGFTKLNELVIAQTAQSIYYYCLRVIGETELKIHGIGIGYDWSPHAKDFAKVSAAVFLLYGVRVYMVSEPVSASYAEHLNKHYMCGCGFMATETHISRTECRYIVYGIGRGSALATPHSKNVSEMISASNSHIFIPHPGLQSLDKVLEKGVETRLLVMVSQEHEVSKIYHKKLKLLKYFDREYQKRTKRSFRIGCFLIGLYDICKVTNILQNLFQFSTDAIQSRFVFLKGIQSNAVPPEKCITAACKEADIINSRAEADGVPPIKIIISIDINAEAICLAELIGSPSPSEHCQPQWHIYRKEDINAFAMNWCAENLSGNPTVLARLKKHRLSCGRTTYPPSLSIQTGSPRFIATRYSGVTCKDDSSNSRELWRLSREEEKETECGAVCGGYQGFQNPAEEIITTRDGAIILGVLAELLIDLYEFSGTGINIRKPANEQLSSNTFGGYLSSFTQGITPQTCQVES